MYRVLATDGMDKGAVKILEGAGYEVVQQFYEPAELAVRVKDYDVVVVRSATKIRKDIIDAAVEGGRLKLIIRGGVGLDNIDVAYAESKGLTVKNTPTASSASVAELTIAHIFAVSRFLHISNVTMREGKWEKKAYKGTEIAGKTIGIVGLGKIGSETAKRAAALGMKVVYTNRSGPKEGAEGYEWVSMDDLLARSDYVTLHRPCAKDCPPIIDAEAISKMKDGAYLINAGRGALVDEDALCDALESGKLAGAGIDVYKEEPSKNMRLINNPKVSVTPHIGASTKEAQKRIGDETVKIIRDMFG